MALPLSSRQDLTGEYQKLVLDKYLSFARIGTFVIFFGLSYFIFEDLYIHHLPRESVFFRVLPISLALILLLAISTPLKKKTSLVLFLYYLCLAGLMTMMCGLIAITAGTDKYELYLLGTIVVIFSVYLCNLYGMKYLIPVYFSPFAVLALYLIFSGKLMSGGIAKMSNPLTVAFVCCLLSEIQNRIKYRDFISGKTVEMQNKILSNELSLARSVHVNLLPARTPELQGIRLSTIYLPMIEIGGDLYDYMHFKDSGTHGIFICDVSGHGVSAALISSMVKAHLNTVTSINPSPAHVLNYLNEKLIGQTSGHFVTAFFCIYDPAGRSLTFARGGHSYPLLMRNNEITELTSSGGFIGIMKNRSFQEISIKLEPRDRLVFYTDGLVEARNPYGEMYGEPRLVECLMKHSLISIESFIWKIFDSVIIFQAGKNFDDDVCLICMDIE